MSSLSHRDSINVLYNRKLRNRFGILFTYRYGLNYRFPKPTNFKHKRLFSLFRPFNMSQGMLVVDSDKGWGCVIRSTQMALAQALLNLVMGPSFEMEDLFRERTPRDKRIDDKLLNFEAFKRLLSDDLDLDDISKVSVILGQFCDDQKSVFSIYNFIIADFVLKTCTKFLHFGPTSSALCVSKLINDAEIPLTSVSFPDGVFYIAKVREAFDKNTNVLVWVSLKKKMDRFEKDCVKSMFKLEQFNGIVGGNLLNKSYYIFGTSSKRLLEGVKQLQRAFTSLKYIDLVKDFTSKRVKSMNWRYLNASFTLLFLFKGRDDFNEFLDNTFEKQSSLQTFPFEFVTEGDLTFN